MAKPTLGIADQRWLFDNIWGKAYRQRQIVDGVCARLKRGFGLQARSCLACGPVQPSVGERGRLSFDGEARLINEIHLILPSSHPEPATPKSKRMMDTIRLL